MFPEAGGSSSFARRAFNEFWSFFAAWGQMLNYIITVAISAFFVPHYLGVFWEPLGESPADIVGGILVVVILAALNIIGVKESAGLNFFLALTDFVTQVALVVLGVVLVLDPDTLVDNVDFGTTPTVSDFLIAIPVGMVAYTGIETISNMAEEARDHARPFPARWRAWSWPCSRSTPSYPPLRSRRCRSRTARRLWPCPRKTADTRTTRSSASWRTSTSAPSKGRRGVRRRPRRHDPLHRDQRRNDRRIAAHLLDGTTPPATGAAAGAPPSVRHAIRRDRRVRAGRLPDHPPGQADFLGTIYAFGAMLSFTIAHLAVIALRLRQPERERPYRGPGTLRVFGRELPLFAVVGGLGTATLGSSYRPELRDPGRRQHLAGARGHDLRPVPPPPRPVAHRDPQDRAAQAGVEHEVEYESVLVAFEDANYSPEAVVTAVRLAARRRRGIHVLVTITVRRTSPSTPTRRAGGPCRNLIDSARVLGGRRVTGHWEKVRPAKPGGG